MFIFLTLFADFNDPIHRGTGLQIRRVSYSSYPLYSIPVGISIYISTLFRFKKFINEFKLIKDEKSHKTNNKDKVT